MTESDKNNENETKEAAKDHEDESVQYFDMYRFFSRKDVVFAAILILALLIYLAVRFLLNGDVAA